jgi:uncharacterized protein (DUF1330 family)
MVTDRRRAILRVQMMGNYRVTIALLVGIAIGAGAVTALAAQGVPAYAVIDIAEITDPDTFKTVVANAPAGLLPFGGRYIIRSEKVFPVQGPAPTRFVVIAFDSLEQAQHWSTSAPSKELSAIRARTTRSRLFLVEGLH